jgi:hypothetical protein
VEVGQGPWHSVNSDIYHDNPDCQTGGMIDPENIRPGTGGKRLCEECARLDRAAGSVAPPMGDLTGEPGRGPRGREEDLSRRAAATSQPSGAADDPLGGPRVRRAGVSRGGVGAEEEARLEESVRRGARRAIDEKEQEETGGGGLYGSQIDASHIIGAAIAELVGTFILVNCGCCRRDTCSPDGRSAIRFPSRSARLRARACNRGRRRRSCLGSACKPGRNPWDGRYWQVPLAIHPPLHSGAARRSGAGGLGHLGDIRRSGGKG